MALEPAIETHPFTRAKATLSQIMSQVVYTHEPQAIDRHDGKEQVFIVPSSLILGLAGDVRLNATASVVEREFIVQIPELGVIGGGDTLDDAIDDVLDAARAFAQVYLHNYRYHFESHDLAQLGLVTTVAFSDEDVLRKMLLSEPAPLQSA